jgi:predicted small lipoprotein YifL
MRMRRLPLLIAIALLAACGQRGDLYMPATERQAVVTTPAESASPAAPDDDEPGTPPNTPAGNAGQ